MKNLKYLSIILFAIFNFQYSISPAQSLSPRVSPSCGGYFTAGGNSLSWTMGETFYTTLQGGGRKLTQGFQQPYILVKLVNITAFIQGFYTSPGQMQALLYNFNSSTYPSNACDSITVELHAATSPYGLVASVNALLQTDGSAIARFPGTLSNASYYVVIRHRNSLETWSASPVILNGNLTYNFANAQNKSYGNNSCDMNDGHFAIWSGDVNQDATVSSQDFIQIENATPLFTNGYDINDITGDLVVESADYSLIENNSELFITRMKP